MQAKPVREGHHVRLASLGAVSNKLRPHLHRLPALWNLFPDILDPLPALELVIQRQLTDLV